MDALQSLSFRGVPCGAHRAALPGSDSNNVAAISQLSAVCPQLLGRGCCSPSPAAASSAGPDRDPGAGAAGVHGARRCQKPCRAVAPGQPRIVRSDWHESLHQLSISGSLTLPEPSIWFAMHLVSLRRWTSLNRGSGEQFLRGLSRIFGGPRVRNETMRR